jgi:hypothetical protein
LVFVLGIVEGTRGRGSEIRDIKNKMTQDNGMELLYRPTINISDTEAVLKSRRSLCGSLLSAQHM